MPPRRDLLPPATVLGLCLSSGALLTLCFPPAGLWPLAWVALAPWLTALRMGGRGGALVGSWSGGFIFFAGMLYWLARFGVSVWMLASLILSLPLLLWGLCVWWGDRLRPGARILGAAVLWCGVEWARGMGPYGFTWGWLGYSQSPALAVVSVARIASTVGISFLVVLANAALAELLVAVLRRESVGGAATAGALALSLVLVCVVGAAGYVKRRGGPRGPAVRTAVIQGSAHGELRPQQVNVPLTREERQLTMATYGSLTEQVASDLPSLVVWPESVLPGAPDRDPAVAEWVTRSARECNAWLLAGGPHYDERGRLYNSAYLYAPSGHRVARYDKVHLVPFGEYVPARDWLPFLDRYNVRDVDFSAAHVHRLLQTEAMTLGPMICFESIFPRISWQHTRRGAQVLVVITNDAWFGRTAAAAQHRQIAVLRAVETNRWVLRAASAGISSIIAPDGRIVAEAGLFERKSLLADIALASRHERAPALGPRLPWVFVCMSIAYLVMLAALPRIRPSVPASRRRTPRRRRGRAVPR